MNIASETNHRDESRGLTREGVSMQGISEAAERVNGGSVFNFELKDLEVIEISYTFASRNKNVTNMPRSTRKKSKTGTCHVMLRVNTEPFTTIIRIWRFESWEWPYT